jgi:hypothetical protein
MNPVLSSLDQTLAHLTRAFQICRGLLRAQGAWMAGVPYWDAKLELGDHLWGNAQSAADLLRRLHELKETAAERQESGALSVLLDELVAVHDGDAFLHGCHGVFIPHVRRVLSGWAESTDPVMDPLSRRLLGEAADRLAVQAEWYRGYQARYSPGAPGRTPAWADHVRMLCERLDFAQGAWTGGAPEASARPAEGVPFAGVATPRRDACFRTAWFNEVARRSGDSFEERRRTIFYNHTQEMQFAESLAAILYDTPEMPWAFHFDLARHCVDEIRHTRMGCARLEQLGEDLRTFPMLLQNYSVRAKLEPIERFCLMTLVIEASSFEKKRANVRMFAEHGDTTSERYESYDIRDEMMHVNFGHTWVPIMLRVNRDTRSVNELINHCRDLLDDALKDERRAG